MINSITIVSIFREYIDSIQKYNFFLFVWALEGVSLNSHCKTILFSVILHQKEGLNFFDVLVSDRKHIVLNKHLTTQNRQVGLSKTVLTSNIRLHVPTQHSWMFGTYTFVHEFCVNILYIHLQRVPRNKLELSILFFDSKVCFIK